MKSSLAKVKNSFAQGLLAAKVDYLGKEDFYAKTGLCLTFRGPIGPMQEQSGQNAQLQLQNESLRLWEWEIRFVSVHLQ